MTCEPRFTDWRESFSLFRHRMLVRAGATGVHIPTAAWAQDMADCTARLAQGVVTYGDLSWREAPEYLRTQVREELLDVVNWSAILAHREPAVADDMAEIALAAVGMLQRLRAVRLP